MTLSGPKLPPQNVHLAASDVASLPFADGSLSFVATQYLLDIVPDPARIAQEINRVFEVGGIWFNFGLPFHLVSDPSNSVRWGGSDMDTFLSRFMFEPATILETTIRHLDLTHLDAAAIGVENKVVLFTAQKAADMKRDPVRDAILEYFRGNVSLVRQLIPRIWKREKLLVVHINTISDRSEKSSVEVRLGRRGRPIKLDTLSQEFIEKVWRAIDGRRAISDVIDLVIRSFGVSVKEEDVILIFQKIKDFGLIEFSFN